MKKRVMGYRTHFEGSDIHHSNSGLQITHMYINGYFITLFDLTPDRSASEAHTSLPENGNIRIELQFSKPLPESITCLLYLEYESTVLVNFSRSHDRFLIHKMDTWQILCTLRDVNSFLDVFPLIYYRRHAQS